MVDLIATSPFGDLLPVTRGGLTLSEVAVGRMSSVAPFNGADKSVSAALKKATGLSLPKPGRSRSAGAARILWTGRGQFFVINADVPQLDAAITDQSDAWAVAALQGDGAGDVLARLCPVDCAAMTPGDVIRSTLGHMMAVISRQVDGYELMVFRAFAQTFTHELSDVMASLTAQHDLPD